mmetsp:Transcript_11565/g.23511  ORF Transcript_11565/g.23511 Transcript_11565/m.23511 type:complete len:128 (+) Transcript_11565:880-1263(+)
MQVFRAAWRIWGMASSLLKCLELVTTTAIDRSRWRSFRQLLQNSMIMHFATFQQPLKTETREYLQKFALVRDIQPQPQNQARTTRKFEYIVSSRFEWKELRRNEVVSDIPTTSKASLCDETIHFGFM